MKAGDIIFVRGKSPLSKCVKFFDNGEFSHIAIAVSDTHIFEANWYTRAEITEFHFEDYEIIDLGLTEEERQLIVSESFKLIGKWYDYFQILWYILKRFFNPKGRNRFNNPNMLICSEAVYILLNKLGKEEIVGNLNIDATPNELYRYLTVFVERNKAV